MYYSNTELLILFLAYKYLQNHHNQKNMPIKYCVMKKLMIDGKQYLSHFLQDLDWGFGKA